MWVFLSVIGLQLLPYVFIDLNAICFEVLGEFSNFAFICYSCPFHLLDLQMFGCSQAKKVAIILVLWFLCNFPLYRFFVLCVWLFVLKNRITGKARRALNSLRACGSLVSKYAIHRSNQGDIRSWREGRVRVWPPPLLSSFSSCT